MRYQITYKPVGVTRNTATAEAPDPYTACLELGRIMGFTAECKVLKISEIPPPRVVYEYTVDGGWDALP